MKHLHLFLFCFLSLGLISFGQTNQKSKKGSKSNQTELTDQQLILQIEEDLRKAKVDNNVQRIDEILTADYKGLNQYGVASNKAQGIANWANRKNLVLTLDSASVTLVSDTTAMAKGLQTEDGVQMRFERNYVKQNGKWRLISMRQRMMEYKGTKGIGKYRINGHLTGADGLAISLMTTNSANGKISNLNAAIAKEGIFTMEGEAVEYPQMVYLTTPGKNVRASFFLENSEITITGNVDSLSKVKITGSKTQNEYASCMSGMDVFRGSYESISKEMLAARQSKDSVRLRQISKEIEAVMVEVKKVQIDFVKNNPNSYATPVILQGLMSSMEPSELESIVKTLDPEVARTHTAIIIKSRIRELKAVAIGQKAPDFTQNDVNGNPVSLSSKIGPKLLLVDFWAAWCGPCRAENPNVVRVYNEFKSKGFDVLGVSLDRTKDDWVKAIEKDKLTWTHISDLQYWNNAAARLYAVTSIPANFLLDQNGIIVARNIRGEALYEKVNELLGGK